MKNYLSAKLEIGIALYRVGRKFRLGKWEAIRYAIRSIKPR